MSILAIVISLLLLMFLAYRGISVLLLAPLMACLAVLLSGDAAFLLPIYTDTFMRALGNYVIQFFPLFLLGALFGQLMADSGAAQSIANGAHLWRRIAIRRCFCHLSDQPRTVSQCQCAQATNSGFHCAWLFYVHHDSPTGDTFDTERDSHSLL